MFGCFVVGFYQVSYRISKCGNGAELEYVSLPSKLSLWEGNWDSSSDNQTFSWHLLYWEVTLVFFFLNSNSKNKKRSKTMVL